MSRVNKRPKSLRLDMPQGPVVKDRPKVFCPACETLWTFLARHGFDVSGDRLNRAWPVILARSFLDFSWWLSLALFVIPGLAEFHRRR